MKKILQILILVIFPVVIHAGNDNNFLLDYLLGNYTIIGGLPDSDKIYQGKVKMLRKGDSLKVTRIIDKEKTIAEGKIETATGDKIKVLRIRFKRENRIYEGTYLIDTDLDNNARLTGFLYLEEGGTKNPGLEALFINHWGK